MYYSMCKSDFQAKIMVALRGFHVIHFQMKILDLEKSTDLSGIKWNNVNIKLYLFTSQNLKIIVSPLQVYI